MEGSKEPKINNTWVNVRKKKVYWIDLTEYEK